MNGPLLTTASPKRMRRLASWTLPLLAGLVLAAGTYNWGALQ